MFAATEYVEGKSGLCQLLSDLRKRHAIERAKARARETFGMDVPGELVQVDGLASNDSAEMKVARTLAKTGDAAGKAYLDLGLSVKENITWIVLRVDETSTVHRYIRYVRCSLYIYYILYS